jgi:hypothetical protein
MGGERVAVVGEVEEFHSFEAGALACYRQASQFLSPSQLPTSRSLADTSGV